MGLLIAGFVAVIGLLTPRWTFGRSETSEASPSAESVPVVTPRAARGGVAVPAPLGASVATMARAVLAVGDGAGLASRAGARLRRPRRDYMGREAGPAAAPDYMRRTALDVSAPLGTSISPVAVSYLGTSAYGLRSRQPRAAGGTRRPTYGLEGGRVLRAVAGTRAIEAGDVVVSPPHSEAPVGRFYPAPTEHVEAGATVLRGPSSKPLLVSALTASVTTSVLALLLRPPRRR
jgi:hypothetical protein